jgi:hypothetical protein
VIEVSSFPEDLEKWDGKDPPFYLEVLGETSPRVDVDYAEVLHPGAAAAEGVSSTPIYEYWWTLGHAGRRPTHRHRFSGHDSSIWAHLDDPAARVYMYFPTNAGWRVKELVATVKYLSPVQDQRALAEKAEQDWRKLTPVLSSAGAISAALAPVPGLGVAAVGAAPLLSALSKLQIGSVPQGARGFGWYVDKVTTAGVEGRGVLQGVMWSIPKKMFETLGGRLTGSVAVSFIQGVRRGATDRAPKPAKLAAHAVVLAAGQARWAPPATNRFVELQIAPAVTTNPTAGA